MLKPIDLQQVVVQIDHADKVQQVQQHPDRQQRFLDLQLQAEKRLLNAKVNDPEETGKARIRDEKRDGQRDQQAGHGHKEKPPPMVEAEAQDDAAQGRLIDIKV